MKVTIIFTNRKPLTFVNITEISQVKHLTFLSTPRGESLTFKTEGIKKLIIKPSK